MPQGFHIGDIVAKDGLTRWETVEREMVIYALRRFMNVPFRRDARGRILPGRDRSGARAAAVWLGVHYQTVYRYIRTRDIAYRIRPQAFRGRARKKGDVGVKRLLEQLGVQVPQRQGTFWSWPDEVRTELMMMARKRWLRTIAESHPDRGGDADAAMALNATWNALKRLCRRHRQPFAFD